MNLFFSASKLSQMLKFVQAKQNNFEMEMEKFWELPREKKNYVTIFGLCDIFNPAVKTTFTKRNILSLAASLYDPISYIQPIIIRLKLLFQEICFMNVSLEEVIDE